MGSNTKVVHVRRRGLLAVASAALASAIILTSAASAFAETPARASAPVAQEQSRNYERSYERLEKLYQRELKVLGWEDKALAAANKAIARVQTFIDNQNAKGKDTVKLVSALAAFQTAVGQALTDHNSARSILDAHSGFADSGEVTDIAEAKQTVLTAGKAERRFHHTLRQARLHLGNALRQYRQANRPNPV